MTELHLYDFGIFIELDPDEEEKQLLENNIQTALAQQLIDLDDAIDIREVKNVKLANQLLKIKRQTKLERDQAIQQENMKAQADANAQAQQAAAQAEMQKNEAATQAQQKLEITKGELKLKHLEEEVKSKKELMQFEFDLNMRMRDKDSGNQKVMETFREDRKDRREDKAATHASEMARQKQAVGTTKKFESSGNDILGSGMGLDKFSPQIGN